MSKSEAREQLARAAAPRRFAVNRTQRGVTSRAKALEEPHGSPNEGARALAGAAYGAGSEDNISVIVAVLAQALA